MKYRLIERKTPGDTPEVSRWYATPILSGKLSQENISKEIAGRSSLTRGDVSNVIMNMIDTFPSKLLEGNSIRLDGFGTFRVSFSSSGVDDVEQFNTAMIKKPKIIFTPSVELKKALLGLSFEQE